MRFIGTGLLAIPYNDAAHEEGEHVRIVGKRCFVDTRRAGDGMLPEPAAAFPLREPTSDEVKKAALFVDLGSTRTLGLVVPDKEASLEDMECRTLDLVDYAKSNDEAPGPFSSQVVLERPPEGVEEATWPLSEVRTGKAASELYLYAAHRMAGAKGRGIHLMASSPKRMIARMGPDPSWRTIGRGAEPPLQRYSGFVQEGGARAEGLVPSRLVGMQVVELLEQTERMLNSQEEVHAYRVDEVHVTYPPGWLGPVQKNYKELIQAEVDRWARKRALSVEVKVGCSEAEGALVFHWYNRRLNEQRHGGKGGVLPVRREELLAVVDVGGGTSDLLVEKIEIENGGVAFTPIRRQSENTAGDELVRRVAVELVLPTLIEKCYVEGEQDTIRTYLQDDEHGAEKRLWMRKELLPLAQCFTQAAGAERLQEVEKLTVGEHLEAIIGKLDDVVNKSDREDLQTETDSLTDSILKKASCQVAKLAKSVFEPLAESFARICLRHGCTEVKLSGKAMDYRTVEKVFQGAFQTQGLTNIGLLVGQPIAEELRRFLGCDTVRDSKYATVWGSICKWLIETCGGHFAKVLDINILSAGGEPRWYLHGMASRLSRNDCATMPPIPNEGSPSKRSIVIPMLPMALSYVVGQKIGVDDGGDAPVRMFKLDFRNPAMHLYRKTRAEINLEIAADGRPRVKRVQQGRVVMDNGISDLLIDHLEVMPALDYATNAFWLDSGKVELPKVTPRGGDGEGAEDKSSKAGAGSGTRRKR